MKPTKIVSFFESLKIGGGVEKVQATVGSGLFDSGYEMIYLVMEDRQPRNDYKGKIVSLNEKFIFGFGFKKILSLFLLARRVATFCKNESIDVILGQGDFFYMIVSLSKILFGNPAKCIGVVHTTIGIWPVYITKILVFLLKKLDRVILISQEECKTFLEKYKFKKDQLQVIYNSIDTKQIELNSKESIPEKYNYIFDNKKFTFINIGRLTYQKNQKLLLDAFELFHKEYKNAQLLVLGDGELREELSDHKETLASREDIYFLGNQVNVFPFLKHSDCFVLSSRFEGFPMVLLEVASCASCPIISVDCPTGPSELISQEFLVQINGNEFERLSGKMRDVYLGKLSSDEVMQKNKEKSLCFDYEKIKNEWNIFIESL